MLLLSFYSGPLWSSDLTSGLDSGSTNFAASIYLNLLPIVLQAVKYNLWQYLSHNIKELCPKNSLSRRVMCVWVNCFALQKSKTLNKLSSEDRSTGDSWAQKW